MARIISFRLNRNSRKQRSQRDEVPPTVADRLARLSEEMKGLERLVAEQAAQKALPSFMAIETRLKEKLDAGAIPPRCLRESASHEIIRDFRGDNRRTPELVIPVSEGPEQRLLHGAPWASSGRARRRPLRSLAA